MWEWGLSTFCFFLLPSVTSPLRSLSLSPTTSPQVSPTEMIKSKSDCFEESPKNRPVGQNQWQQQIAGSFVLLRILRYTFSLYIHPCFVFIGCWFLFGQIRNQSESQKAITITFTSYLQVHTGLDPAAVRFKERLLYRGVCFEEEEDLTSRQCKVSCCILNLPSVWSPAIHIPRTKIFYWRLMKLPWSWALALLFPPTLLCKSDRLHLANFRQPFALAPSGNYLPF